MGFMDCMFQEFFMDTSIDMDEMYKCLKEVSDCSLTEITKLAKHFINTCFVDIESDDGSSY